MVAESEIFAADLLHKCDIKLFFIKTRHNHAVGAVTPHRQTCGRRLIRWKSKYRVLLSKMHAWCLFACYSMSRIWTWQWQFLNTTNAPHWMRHFSSSINFNLLLLPTIQCHWCGVDRILLERQSLHHVTCTTHYVHHCITSQGTVFDSLSINVTRFIPAAFHQLFDATTIE